MIDYKQIITVDPQVRSGQATIRGMRITVSDILAWLASGMTVSEITEDFDELTESDIYAALSYASNKEARVFHTAI